MYRLCKNNKGPMGHIAQLSNIGFMWAIKGYCTILPVGRLTKNEYSNFVYN